MFSGLFVDALLVSPYLQHSQTELHWSIAAPAPTYQPNILSELTFRDIESQGAGLRVAWLKLLSSEWALYLEGDYADARIGSGRAQDSDYAGNNRTHEYSRAYADITDDRDRRFALSVGLKTRWLGREGHYFTALMGHRHQDLDLTLTNGVQFLPSAEQGDPLEGLNSSYDSDFRSWSAGFMTEHVLRWGTIGLRFEYHDIEFQADATWNLRQDLAQPRSFSHIGDGSGSSITVGYGYAIAPQWHLQIDYTHHDYEIRHGTDRVYFSSGSHLVTRLNEVEFDGSSWRVGVSYVWNRDQR